MARKRIAGVTLACSAVVALLGGCAVALVAGGAAAGAGAAFWYEGALRTSLPVPLDQVRKAAVSAVQAAGSGVVEDTGDIVSRNLKSALSDGRSVSISLSASAPDVTKISIRVGTLGDEARSQALLAEIRRRLDLPAL